jgi:tRNA(Arg) A34 adenosine deaminase TadA
VNGGLAKMSAAEWACLDRAWQALLRGNVPVGAAILDGSGTIIATGQNMVYSGAPASLGTVPRYLARSLLAHAEVNALAGLTPERKYADCKLVTSLEPCPLCMGAVAQATVGRVCYLGADPFNGAAALRMTTRYTSRVPLTLSGPREDAAGRLAAGLHVAFFLRRNPAGACATVHRELRPDLVDAAESLIAADLFGLAERQRPWDAVAEPLLAAVARSSPADRDANVHAARPVRHDEGLAR